MKTQPILQSASAAPSSVERAAADKVDNKWRLGIGAILLAGFFIQSTSFVTPCWIADNLCSARKGYLFYIAFKLPLYLLVLACIVSILTVSKNCISARIWNLFLVLNIVWGVISLFTLPALAMIRSGGETIAVILLLNFAGGILFPALLFVRTKASIQIIRKTFLRATLIAMTLGLIISIIAAIAIPLRASSIAGSNYRLMIPAFNSCTQFRELSPWRSIGLFQYIRSYEQRDPGLRPYHLVLISSKKDESNQPIRYHWSFAQMNFVEGVTAFCAPPVSSAP